MRIEQSQGKEDSEMRDYELIYIIHPDLDESNLNEINEKITGWITKAGGSIQKMDLWGKRRLAYPIRKTREGQYVYVNTSMPPTFTKELESNLQFLEPVLRYMIVAIS